MKKNRIVTMLTATLLLALAGTGAAADPTDHREVINGDLLITHGGELFLVDAAGGNSRQITHDADPFTTAEFSPDGSRIVFAAFPDYDETGSDNVDLFVMNADGTGVVRVTSTANAIEDYPTWSPDGSEIAFVKLSASSNWSPDLMAMAPAPGQLSERSVPLWDGRTAAR
ncbi:MAG: hypothetical protein V9G19_06935 [Tetrasphaera sp.]